MGTVVVTFSVFRCSHRSSGRVRRFLLRCDGNSIPGDRVGANKIRSGEMFSRGYDGGYTPNFSM